jgi:PHD/YefM family antitoxin component YafN of YafNO toxin-antitoxin module
MTDKCLIILDTTPSAEVSMSTVNMRDLSRNTKSVIEEVIRSGRPAIVTLNGRPQVAVTPLVGAFEAAEEHVLRNAPAHIQKAVREAEADLISGRASLVDDSVFTNLGEEERPSLEELLASLADQLNTASTPVEDAIRTAAAMPDPVSAVREALMHVNVFAVGSPAGDVAPEASGGTESDIVTYAIEDDDGQGGVMLPVFTRVDVLRSALIRNTDWQSLAILQLNGKELIQNVDPDVTIVVNPWSDREFRVPPTGRRTFIAEQPIVAASELVREPA